MSHLVFVYGSLKKGFHNHRLVKRADLDLGAATTAQSYLMLGGFSFPFLIDPATLARKTDLSDVIGRVRGEVYEVDDATLARLDLLEGHPEFYKRELVEVRPEDHPEPVMAWVYFLQDADACTRGHVIWPDEAGYVEWTRVRVGLSAATEGEG